jgi:hypothetical protein
MKMKHSIDFPYMNGFMKKAAFETAPVVKNEITKINQHYTVERAMLFFKDLDYSKFKDGIDPKMVLNLLSWCSEGCANQLMMKAKLTPNSINTKPDFNEILKMFQSYTELLRKNFYKEEFL